MRRGVPTIHPAGTALRLLLALAVGQRDGEARSAVSAVAVEPARGQPQLAREPVQGFTLQSPPLK